MSVATPQVATNMGMKDYGNAKTAPGTGGVTKPGSSALNSQGRGRPMIAPEQLQQAQAAYRSQSNRRAGGR